MLKEIHCTPGRSSLATVSLNRDNAVGCSRQVRGGDDQVEAHSKKHHKKTGPSKETTSTQLVGVARLGPLVGGVDGGIAIHISTVLVLKLVHTLSPSLPSSGIHESLLLHDRRRSNQILPYRIILNRLNEHLLGVGERLTVGNNVPGCRPD